MTIEELQIEFFESPALTKNAHGCAFIRRAYELGQLNGVKKTLGASQGAIMRSTLLGRERIINAVLSLSPADILKGE